MIAYVKGNITYKSPAYVIVEAGGIGYQINVSLHTYAAIEKLEQVKLITYYHVKEDSHTLYGFASAIERNLFVHLISVSGIGPNTARILLSSMTPEEVKSAIIGEDVNAFKMVKGIGIKTAKRIILDLKDKLVKESGDIGVSMPTLNNTLREETLSALVALGYKRTAIQKPLNQILKNNPQVDSVEGLIKLALKLLA